METSSFTSTNGERTYPARSIKKTAHNPSRLNSPNLANLSNQMHLIVLSAEFRELERAVKTVRRAERIMRELNSALRLIENR